MMEIAAKIFTMVYRAEAMAIPSTEEWRQVLGKEFSTHDPAICLFQIGVMLTAGLAFGELMRRLRQPAVLGITRRNALGIGFAMNARGAMEMILASVALDHGLIDEPVFVALVSMALVTSLLSGPALQQLLNRPRVFVDIPRRDNGRS